MPRQKKHDRPIRKELKVPQSICEAVDLRLVDKFTGKPMHGAWSELVSHLLSVWVEGEADISQLNCKTTAKSFCEKCLNDLPLASPCTNKECPYVQAITTGNSSNDSGCASEATGTLPEDTGDAADATEVRPQKGSATWGN